MQLAPPRRDGDGGGAAHVHVPDCSGPKLHLKAQSLKPGFHFDRLNGWNQALSKLWVNCI
jgi:hypothetical protein